MMLAAPAALAEDAHVRVSGSGAVLEQQDDGVRWAELCRAPCSVTIADADRSRPLRVRAPAGTREVAVPAGGGDVSVDVEDRRNVRTVLGVTSGLAAGAALTMFVIAVATAVNDLKWPVGCDDFSGTREASLYPNGKTCPPTSSAAGTEAAIGGVFLGVSALAAIGAIATTPLSVSVSVTRAPSGTAVSAKLLTFTF